MTPTEVTTEPAGASVDPDQGSQAMLGYLEGLLAHTSHGRHVSRSSVDGLFAGGAQRTDAAMYTSVRWSPSSAETDVGWFANPVR